MRFFFSFFFLALFLNTIAQQTTLTGAIVIGNAEVMSYKITYDLSNNNILSGYSLCDVNGKEETKARITGFYNPKNKTLNFEEISILSTKSKAPVDEFCLMKVNGIFEKKGGKLIYTGKFESGTSNPQISCSSGTLVLLTEKGLDELATKANKVLAKAPSSESKGKVTEAKPIPADWVRNVIELGAGSVKEFELKSNEIQLDIVDDRFQDGDKITLTKNGVTVVTGLEITNRVKSFKFTTSGDDKDLIFTIKAEDEGSIALTTVKAVLRNGNEVNMFMICLNKGEAVKIAFRKAHPSIE